ncbi:MAG: GguC protein [Neomegalonema sp.]|nr:GguC protein [Neomegalonema sp.]
MLLSQIKQADGQIAVVARDGDDARQVRDIDSVYALAMAAAADGVALADKAAALGFGPAVDLAQAAEEGRLLPPIHHPDPAHLMVAGTGLTHLGSASARNSMHQAADDAELTDSMRMFRMGVDGGKPEAGAVGVQPEWFYKSDGAGVVAPGAPLTSPAFADDGGEEPEIAGVYIIDADGAPHRVGFALANEFSDHVMEKQNYLYLAHSKLRQASFGPEILVGALPADVRGVSRIHRDGAVIFEGEFLSGEANMSHTIANLEHHHFKYAQFRRPGDIHVHMFGTATLSFANGVRTQAGDIFEIEAPQFGLPLRNPLAIDPAPANRPTPVHAL